MLEEESRTTNFWIYGSVLDDYINWVSTSNLDDGKPIYCCVNQNGLLIDSETHPSVGFLVLANCTNMTIRNLALSGKNKEALLLAYTADCTLVRNVI